MHNLLKNKYNQKTTNLPTYILFFMACYVIWQMGIIWLDANNSVIESASGLSHNFMSNLASLCGIISIITIIFLGIKIKYSYILCKISSFISLLITLCLLMNVHTEIYLYILVSSCSVMSISSLAIYFCTYSSNNLKRQVIIEMIGVAIIGLIFHSDIIKLPFFIYNLVSVILLSLFIIGLCKISNLNIQIKKSNRYTNNFSLYIGITILIIVFHIVSLFGSIIISQIKYGNTLFYIGGIVGALLYFLLNKSNMKKVYIPTIYIALFLLSLAFFNISFLVSISSFLLGMSNTLLFALPYYCNLVFKNTYTKGIYFIFNMIGIVEVIFADILLNITNNNIDTLIKIYIIIAIISLCIIFILINNINLRIDKMFKLEKKEIIFKDLTSSEINVAELLLKNYTNKQIASEIYLSTNTVKFHIKSIFKKLNITSRKELMELFEK